MFVPLLDDAPVRRIRRPWVNYGFVAICTVIFVVFQSGVFVDGLQATVVSFGLIPSVLFGDAVRPDPYAYVPVELTVVTSLFLHGGWLHLIGNLMFLWVFGDNVEDDLGHLRYVAFLLLCGVGAGLSHAAGEPGSDAPLVGASGVVAGVVAAYVMLHPQVKVWVLVFYRFPLRLRAFWIIGAWIVFQIGNAFLSSDSQIAWLAHVGGFVTGAALVWPLKRREVALFDRDLNDRIAQRADRTLESQA